MAGTIEWRIPVTTPMRRRRARYGFALVGIALAVVLWANITANAAVFNVSIAADDGLGTTVGTLSYAITQANGSAGNTITFSVPTVTLSQSLPQLTQSTTVTGGGVTIQANNHQAFTVDSATTVSFTDMTINGALVQGGAGSAGRGGGAGGLGGGAGIYVGNNPTTNVGSNVTIQNVVFTNNQAQGGAGGQGTGTGTTGGAGGNFNVTGKGSGAGYNAGGGAAGNTGNGGDGGYGGGGGGAGSTGTAGGTGNGGGNGGAPGVGGGGGLALGGAVFVSNGSTLTINGTTAGGNTIINGTNQAVGGAAGSPNASAGTGSGGGLYVGIGSTAIFNNSGTDITVSGDIFSNGQITISGSGAAVVNFIGGTTTNSTQFSTGTLVSSGTLNGTTDTLQGPITDNAQVTFTQNFNGAFLGSLSGTGHVTLAGTGLVLFTQANSYSGGTLVSNGVLAGTTANIQGNIVDNSVVLFSQNGNGTYTGNISGTGSVVKNGTGAAGFNGTQTYTGATFVNQGTLAFDGTSTSPTTVASGAALTGGGAINATVTNNGVIAPGNGIGTLTTGNYVSNSGSNLQVQINNAGTVPGVNNDRVQANGNVTLNGGAVTVQPAAGQYTAGMKYTFLNFTGARTGAFDSIQSNLTYLDAQLIYEPNDVAFQLITNYTRVAQTFNQFGVANYLDQQSATATGSFANVLNEINQLSAADGRQAFQRLEGEVYGTTAQLGIQNTTFLYQLLRRGANGEGLFDGSPRRPVGPHRANVPEPPFTASNSDGEQDIVLVNHQEPLGPTDANVRQPVFQVVKARRPRWNAWSTGYGFGGNAQGDGNASGTVYGIGGTIVALDRCLCDGVKFGIFGVYSHTALSLANPQQRNRADDGQFGSYLRGDNGRQYLLWAGSIGFDNYHSTRAINFGAINSTANASYNGWQATNYVETGLSVPFWPCDLQPFVALQYLYLRQNAFTETGADPLNLSVAGNDNHALRNMLGTRFTWDCDIASGRRLSPELRAVWLHEYLTPVSTINSVFSGIGGTNFATRGLNFGRDWALLGGGVNWALSDRLSMGANYDLQFNQVQAFHVGSGNLQYRW